MYRVTLQKLLGVVLLLALTGFSTSARAGFIGSSALTVSGDPTGQMVAMDFFGSAGEFSFADFGTASALGAFSPTPEIPIGVTADVAGSLDAGEPLAFAFAEAQADHYGLFENTGDDIDLTLTESISASIDATDAGSVDFDWFAIITVLDSAMDFVDEIFIAEFASVSDIGDLSYSLDRTTDITVGAGGYVEIILSTFMAGAIAPGVVAAVPEPGTVTLLLAGLLFLGMASRRSTLVRS